ncbi:MAG: hypothetical protein Q8P24_21515 [Desulfobacterales bacterium]|nr:hypothetical protein [Desulfobacterales bacterium]
MEFARLEFEAFYDAVLMLTYFDAATYPLRNSGSRGETGLMLVAGDFFNLREFAHRDIFSEDEAVWTALDRLPGYLGSFFRAPWPLAGITGQVHKSLAVYDGQILEDIEVKPCGPKGSIRILRGGKVLEGAAGIMAGACLLDDNILIGPGTIVEPGVFIKGPVVIGSDTEIRQGAYIRGDCLVGDHCVVGHTTELKGSIMLDGAKAGHFAYVGDSILGNDVNLGAGTKLANLKMIPGQIVIRKDKKRINTGRRKLGAILGDRTQTGCNAVTSPGTLTGPDAVIYPGVCAPSGYYPAKTYFMPSHGTLKIFTPNQSP